MQISKEIWYKKCIQGWSQEKFRGGFMKRPWSIKKFRSMSAASDLVQSKAKSPIENALDGILFLN